MITRAEAERSLTGIWRLFLNKPDAMRFLDTSAEGFWRSFRAIVLVAPLYAVTVLADWYDLKTDSIADEDISGGVFTFAKFLMLVADWALVPAALGAVSGLIGIRRGFPAYVVARNWGSVLAAVPFAIVAFLDLSGILQPALLFMPSIVALGAVLRLNYLAARRTLGTTPDIAIGVVALDILLGLALVTIINGIFGIPAFGG